MKVYFRSLRPHPSLKIGTESIKKRILCAAYSGSWSALLFELKSISICLKALIRLSYDSEY